MNVDLNIDAREALSGLSEKVKQADPHRVATRVAVPVARHWREHLAKMPHNKQGYPSTGFWEDAARRVKGVAFGDAVELTSDKLGLRQRLHGGTIAAINYANITIPICAEAYGTTVADWGFENLTLVILADGRKFYALWLGNEETARRYKSTVGDAVKRWQARQERMASAGRKTGVPTAEPKNKAVAKFKAGGVIQRPKVIIFTGSGGHSASRAERHGDLKFLFALVHEVDQAANPDVVPSDLQDVAVRAAEEAVA